MHYRFIILILLISLISGIQLVLAQTEVPSTANNKETSQTKFIDHFEWIRGNNSNIHEFHVVGGYSFHSSRGFWGKIPKGNLGVLGLRYNRKILELNNIHTIEYVSELNISVHYSLSPTKFEYGSGEFSGFGGTPLGFQINLGKRNVIQPFFKTSTGFMYFKRPFPDERGRKFNFTLELGGGVEYMISQNFSFTLGYKYHHMSNFFLGTINPGIDSNIFYTGITIF